MYKDILRPILFNFDSETIHHHAVTASQILAFSPLYKMWNAAFAVRDTCLESEAFGLQFFNPLGLAAGFDKHIQMVPFLAATGFGHVEVGTITPKPQQGNPRPRIFRLQEDEALINRMGFPSSGMKIARDRLVALQKRSLPIHVGINIGKNRDTPLERAVDDYALLSENLSAYGSWLTINVSSPNTPGLRSLQSKEALRDIVVAVREKAVRKLPVLVKIAPDLTSEQLRDMVDDLLELEVDGVVASNTTISRENIRSTLSEEGGLSGAPLYNRTRETVQAIYQQSEGNLPIIAAGGVRNWKDLLCLLLDGASLVQGYTAFVYEGPGWPRALLKPLGSFLKSQGLSSLKDLAGNHELEKMILPQ